METFEEIKQLVITINELVESGKADGEGVEFWSDAGARILIFIDDMVQKSEKVNSLTPKDYSKDNNCIIEALFKILKQMQDYANEPFDNNIWNQSSSAASEYGDSEEGAVRAINTISFYELSLSRCCSWICQLLGDRFSYVQRLLIKYIFGTSDTCSLFASDIYMFLIRLVNFNHKMTMSQLIMNMCKIAPPEAMVKGAALINRIKHPIVNFENQKYQYLLDFS